MSDECNCDHCKAHHAVEDGLRADLAARDKLLGQWMFWASGVAFKSELGEELVAATDKVLSAP